MEKIDVDRLQEEKYSGLVKVIKEDSGGRRVQMGYLMFRGGSLAEGLVEIGGESYEDEEALEAVRGGEFRGVFDPPPEESRGGGKNLLEEAGEMGALKDLDEELG